MNVSELVTKAKMGDVDAFTELVRRYQAMAFGYAYSRIGDFHLAEDAVQQAFIAAWHGLPRLKQPERFGGWLRSIVRFECSHLLRARRLQLSINDAQGILESEEPAQLVEEQEDLDRVIAAVNNLAETEREVTILYYIHDHSQREVAEFLNLPVTTVNNRLRSARNHLKEGRSLTMANEALKEHRLPKEFASRIGEIVRSQGPIVDARFAPEQRPRVLSELTIATEPPVTIETIQHLESGLVRGVVMTNDDVRFTPGTRIIDTGGPIRVPLDRATIDTVISSLRATNATSETVETGIKVIDLLSPLPKQGRIALVGDMQSGKMVLVEELIRRLAHTAGEISILVFVETPAEAAIVNELEYRTSANVEAIYLPVANTSPDALSDVTSGLDAVISFTRELAEARLYPAIDPAQSTSRLLVPDVVGGDHADTAGRVREILAPAAANRATDRSARYERLRRFLAQPFFVAEEYTHQPGQYVSRSETIAQSRALLDER